MRQKPLRIMKGHCLSIQGFLLLSDLVPGAASERFYLAADMGFVVCVFSPKPAFAINCRLAFLYIYSTNVLSLQFNLG
jgi:hypothetical protein